MDRNKTKIAISDLNLWYGDFQALKHINMDLPAEEITAFIGPSRLRQVDAAQDASTG